MEWQPIETAPRDGTIVLVHYMNSYGKNRIVRALYISRHTVPDDGEDFMDSADYDEEENEYYIPEGWYERMDHGDYGYYFIDEALTHWMPLPSKPR